MNPSITFVNPSEAARLLGVSVKALRIYEDRGLLTPGRSANGWRAYGPDHMRRAADIVSLRSLGFSLAQIGRVLSGDLQGLEHALATHQATLENQLREVCSAVERISAFRSSLASGDAPDIAGLSRLSATAGEVAVAFDLPWPWGGERFELRGIKAINYIIGPLFSGKTKLAMRLAETLPHAAFIGADRTADECAAAGALLNADPELRARVDGVLAWLEEDGATRSDALIALLAGLEVEGPEVLVVDMIEDGLDELTQEALIAYLRRRGPSARPLFLLTRSSAILDLELVGANETILFCPPNHSPPFAVAAHVGAPGYESIVHCLARPDVRARTQGVIAWRAPAA